MTTRTEIDTISTYTPGGYVNTTFESKYDGNGVPIEPVVDYPTETYVTASTDPVTGVVDLAVGGQSIFGSVSDPIKSVVFSGNGDGYAYLRSAWSATLDALHCIRVYSTSQTINGVVDFYGVKTIPIATANTVPVILAAYTAGTFIAWQGDSIGPLNYNSSYMGANHGPSIAHLVTAVAHGKTSADVGSEWSGPSSRKFYIFKIVDVDKIWLVSNNSGTSAQWVFYSTSLSGQTLTHSSGATNQSSIVATADTPATQITPILNNRSLRAEVDGVVVDHTAAGVYVPQLSFKIFENYSIVSPSAAVDYMKANAGQNPAFNANTIFADASIKNIHSFQSNGAHTVDQTITWNAAIYFTYQGVVQDSPPQNVGVLSQYIPGVGQIGGIDYKAIADISGVISTFETAQANWLDQANAPNRMAQITSVGGVNKHGIVLGYSPLTGVGTRVKRASNVTITAGGLQSAATKKQYPKLVSSGHQPAAGETYRAIAYHHVYNAEIVPDATVSTWFADGNDVVVVLDFHKTSDISRVILPAFCDGWRCSMIDSQNVTLLNDVVIDGGGVAAQCTASYGYALIRVAKKI